MFALFVSDQTVKFNVASLNSGDPRRFRTIQKGFLALPVYCKIALTRVLAY